MENDYHDALSPVAELVEKIGSRYQLVNLVARRARQISAEAEEEQIPLEKSLSLPPLTRSTPASSQ